MNALTFGWEEWVSLPDLGLPAIKAKVDTGARTSALHAHDIETFGSSAKPKVRFNVHPIPGREDISITCSAPSSTAARSRPPTGKANSASSSGRRWRWLANAGRSRSP